MQNETPKNVTPAYFMPTGGRLLDRKGLAAGLLRNPRYIAAMVRDGFMMPGNRATLNQALQWLAENPDFRQSGTPKDRAGQRRVV